MKAWLKDKLGWTDQDVYARTVEAITYFISEAADANQRYAARILLDVYIGKEARRKIAELAFPNPVERNDPRVRKWQKSIISKGECEICGSKTNLEAHHILHWAEFPNGRTDEKNGMCLCASCHAREHRGEQVYMLMRSKVAF